MTEGPESATGTPRCRRTLRALLAVNAVSAGSAGALVDLATTAVAATTRSASASERGRGRGRWRHGQRQSEPLVVKPVHREPHGQRHEEPHGQRHEPRSSTIQLIGAQPLQSRWNATVTGSGTLTARPNGSGTSFAITVWRNGNNTMPTASSAVG